MLLTFFDDITLAWLLRAQLGTFLLDIINLAAIGKRTVLAGQLQHIVEAVSYTHLTLPTILLV